MASILTKNQRRRMRLQKKKGDDDDFDKIIKEQQEKIAKYNNNLESNTSIQETLEMKNNYTETSNQNQSSTTDTPSAPKTETVVITREQITAKAKQFWDDVRQYIKEHPEFKQLEDKAKLEFCRSKLGYDQFMNEFPIVSRYMVCLGQFNMKAFIRFLDKCEKAVHPPAEQREKGYNEDQWVRRQADYVQYLWESYQKSHHNNAERKWIWQETYKRLKGEFDDFRNMHKDIEERVKEEKVELQAQNVRELLERLKTGAQKLTPEEEESLLTALQAIANNQHEPAPEPENKIVDEEGRAKITVIETVTEDQMKEIDPNYQPNLDAVTEDDLADCEIIAEEVV